MCSGHALPNPSTYKSLPLAAGLPASAAAGAAGTGGDVLSPASAPSMCTPPPKLSPLDKIMCNPCCIHSLQSPLLDFTISREGLRSPESTTKTAKPLPGQRHVIMKCGFICLGCRVSSRAREAFGSFRCKSSETHSKVVCKDFMCANCDELSDDIESFKAQVCTGKKKIPDSGLPPYVPPEEPAKPLKKPPSFDDCTGPRAEAAPSPKPEPLPADYRVKLLAELRQAEAQLEQLVLLQSLESERKRLQQLMLRKEQQQQGPTSVACVEASLSILSAYSVVPM